ncbi:MAG: tetratricopeptide repeat protein [Alphaproteobacteria bacterium]|nr:tetratricopeptide repeat protein [Alphaproteobacteria bacterium]
MACAHKAAKGRQSRRLSISLAVTAFSLAFAGCQTATLQPKSRATSMVDPGPSSTTGSYLIARQAYRVRDLDRAALNFEVALNDDPENPALLRRTFLAELEFGGVPAAITLARRVEQVGNATGPFMDLALALDASKIGNWAKADEHLLRLPETKLNQILRPLLSGWVAAGRSDWGAAKAFFSKVKSISGFEVLALLHTAHAKRLEGDQRDADLLFKEALKKSGRPPLRLSLAAAIYFASSQRLDEARRILSARSGRDHDAVSIAAVFKHAAAGHSVPGLVGSATDGMSEALFDIASALQRERGNNAAMIMAQLALHMRPAFPLAQLLVGEILDDRGQHEAALRIYRGLPTLSAYHSLAGLRAASSLQGLDRIDESIGLLTELARSRLTDPTPLIRIGDMQRALKRWSAAVEAYDQALERIGANGSGDWELFYTRGIALERANNWRRAEADLLKALELAPDQPYVMNYLGYSWTEQGINLKRAERMIAKAVKLRPRDGYIIDSLGWVLYRTGRFEEAVTKLEKAVQLRPNDPTINDHLGDAYWRVGRQIEASFQWRRALTMKPKTELVSIIQNKLEQGLPPPTIIKENSNKAGMRRAPDA